MYGALEEAIGELRGLDPTTLTGAELRKAVVELQRLSAGLDAVQTRVAAAFDASGDWRVEGARSAAAWLASRCHLPAPVARGRVSLGRALREMPAVEAAWLAGDIDRHHVRVLSQARSPETTEEFERAEKLLVDDARTLRFDDFTRVVAYWRQQAQPDAVEPEAAAVRQGRRFHLSKSLDGLWFGDLVLNPIGGAVVAGQLDRITRELFDADWAEAKTRRGDDVTADDLRRTPAQRRADALVEMARRAGTAAADGRRPAPLVTVLVGHETVAGRICELADGTVITPGSLLPWLDEAHIERVVFDGPSRVIDVGQARRCFDGATRRAIEVRDRECFHPTCPTRVDRCRVDHVQPFAAGGPTTEANGRFACGHHNRLRHQRPPPDDPPPAA